MAICINGEYFNNDLTNGALYVGFEIGYDKNGALDYFWQDLNTKFYDEKKHKVKATKVKNISDEEDQELGLQDWLWKIEIFKKEQD